MPGEAGARQVRSAAQAALAEGEHIEPVAPGMQGVGLLTHTMHQAVPGADLVGARALAPVLP